MQINPAYILKPTEKKHEELFAYAAKDDFFRGVLYDLVDYGYDISFSIFGGAGAYYPHTLKTEALDTPDKQKQFASGLQRQIDDGHLKTKMRFSLLLGEDTTKHYFLHELMHFYQDMHGLYMNPLQEIGGTPIALDAKSYIVAILFCEAWAEIEAIRTSWALRGMNDASGWKGALASPDWSELAHGYDDDMNAGIDEAQAALNTFRKWYEGPHRAFYEQSAYHAYKQSGATQAGEYRTLELPMLIARLPKKDVPKFFHHIHWTDELYTNVYTRDIAQEVSENVSDNPNTQDIKIGSPPYLWNRLRIAAKENAEDAIPSSQN